MEMKVSLFRKAHNIEESSIFLNNGGTPVPNKMERKFTLEMIAQETKPGKAQLYIQRPFASS